MLMFDVKVATGAGMRPMEQQNPRPQHLNLDSFVPHREGSLSRLTP